MRALRATAVAQCSLRSLRTRLLPSAQRKAGRAGQTCFARLGALCSWRLRCRLAVEKGKLVVLKYALPVARLFKVQMLEQSV